MVAPRESMVEVTDPNRGALLKNFSKSETVKDKKKVDLGLRVQLVNK